MAKPSASARANMRIAHTGLKHTAETRAKIGAASRRRHARTEHDGDVPAPDDILDQTMSANDLVFVLEHLRFQGSRPPRSAQARSRCARLSHRRLATA
jgi:hypothetical protein